MAVFQDKNNKTKSGKSWYFMTRYLDLEGNKRQYKSKKYETKKEALEQERLFIMLKTNKKETTSITFNELIIEYMNFQKEKVKITTYNNYHKAVAHLKPLFKIKVNDFKIEQFNMWKEKINSTNYSTVYKNTIYKFLRSVINYGIKYKDINLSHIINKLTGFTNPNELKKEMLFWDYDEFSKFIDKVEDPKYNAYFKMLYYCGLRKEEANALNWNDIDFKNKLVKVNKSLTLKIKGENYVILPPKTKSSIRTLPLPNVLYNSLKSLLDYYKTFNNFKYDWFVFGGIFPLADTTIDKKKNAACDSAKIKRIRVHDIRHSTASLLISNGASITLVAKYLGHSNIATTLNTYTHMFKTELNDIVETIDNLDKNA